MLIDLNNKITLVTGGSRGIGKSIALVLAKAGAKVALTYHRQKQAAEVVSSEIVESGGKSMALQVDVSSRDSVQSAIEKVKENWGPITILINNAAIAQKKPFDDISDDDWNYMLAVNLIGPFACCQEVLPDMLKQGWGRIINISSIGGQWGGNNQVHYSAAKAGLISLSRSLGRIYSKHGITINAVSPGLVHSDMTKDVLNAAEGKEIVKSIPIGRIATVDEVANVVTFLASSEASYITGQTINVNGGMYFG